MKIPWQLGYAIIGLALIGDCFLLACAAREESRVSGFESEPFPDITETPLIQISPARAADYHRPAWQRAILSLRPYSEIGSSHGKIKASTKSAEIAGTYRDDESARLADWLPQSYAIGLTGGAEF